MALVKKQRAEKKSQIEKITIRYEDGTERTVESGLVVTLLRTRKMKKARP